MESLAELLNLQLSHGGQAPLMVTGVSMLPMLTHGRDRVYLVPLNRPLRPGDVILYRRENGKYILHRIIKCIPAGELICCGDNQCELEAVRTEQVIAVVSAFCRNGRYRDIHCRSYRLYTWCWVRLFFLRKPYIVLRRIIGRIRADAGRRQNK